MPGGDAERVDLPRARAEHGHPIAVVLTPPGAGLRLWAGLGRGGDAAPAVGGVDVALAAGGTWALRGRPDDLAVVGAEGVVVIVVLAVLKNPDLLAVHVLPHLTPLRHIRRGGGGA